MTILSLPALTSEDVEVPVLNYDTVPTSLTWEGCVSDAFDTEEAGSPPASAFSSASATNRGTTTSPEYRIRVRVSGLAAGTYGVWVRVAGGAGTSPVRFCGQLRLY